jgi:hypothetical protein
MKRAASFVLGIFLAAIVFGSCGAFVGFCVATSDKPRIVAHNLTATAIPQLNVQTDYGGSYVLTDLQPKKPQRLKIPGRSKGLRITATLPSGKNLTSEHLYLISDGIVFAMVTEDAIVLDYQL